MTQDVLAAAMIAEGEAKRAVMAIKDAAERAGREASDKAKAKVLEESGYDAAVERAREATAARIAAQDATPAHQWQGRRVFKIERQSRGFGYPAREVRVEGVVETRRSDTSLPANLGRYGRPDIGEGFVRFLKKDGTPGLKIDRRIQAWKLLDAEPSA